jgi:hypothetical protein
MRGWINHGRNKGRIFPGGAVKEPNFETVLPLPLLSSYECIENWLFTDFDTEMVVKLVHVLIKRERK